MHRTTNSGENWIVVNNGLESSSVISLAIDPITPTTLYAGTVHSIYKSVNGGDSWMEVNNGLPDGLVYSMVVDPITPTTLYAGINRNGIYKSINGGETWDSFNTGLYNLNVLTLAINPQNPTTIYAGTYGSGVFELRQIVPQLFINYWSGAPGSTFTITGTHFPKDCPVSIEINGIVLGSVLPDPSGDLLFLLATNPTTDSGIYWITATVNNSSATVRLVLDEESEVHPQEGSGTVFALPDGIAYQPVFLPLLVR